uniref:DUF4489 domain-containing protein n=1 Tax=Clostridium sp. NkU-1 TaxID=1095009 RepID=UPI003260CE9E
MKFEFASNIVTTAAVISLNFQVFKQCKGMLTPIPVGPIWTFSRLVAVLIVTPSPSSFAIAICVTMTAALTV